MSTPLGTYSFLPWLRQGLGVQIKAADRDAGVNVRARDRRRAATSSGEQLDGGDADAGRSAATSSSTAPATSSASTARAIVRTEPRHWITNFEPNYLPYVEFYDEDFPWRYTPAAPDAEAPAAAVAHARRARGRRVQGGPEPRGQAAAVRRRRRR